MIDPRKAAALVKRLNDWCDAQPFETGWCVKDVRSGWSADRRGDEVVPSASTRKIAILMAALRAAHQGRFDLQERVDVDTSLDTVSGCLQWMTPGLRLTHLDLMRLMIIVSDNVSTKHVSELVGLDAVQSLCESIGMKATHHRQSVPAAQYPRNADPGSSNETTPRDLVILLDAILAGAQDAAAADRLGVTPELCRLALEILSQQRYKSGLPHHLPEGTQVAHKTGRIGGSVGDAGIIYDGQRPLFILAVLMHHVPLDMPDVSTGVGTPNHLIAQLARACWDTLRTP